jgi:hypothetical protein
VRQGAALILCVWLAAAWAAAAPPAPESRLPGDVIRYGGSEALAARLAWALGQPAASGPSRTFWVGYSIRRLMGEHEMIGSYRDGVGRRETTIEEVLVGKRNLAPATSDREDVQKTARKVLDDLENPKAAEKPVPKDVGIFLSYESGRPATLEAVELSNLDLAFDFHGRDLYWLGPANAAESMELVRRLFDQAASGRPKKGLVAAAGLHGEPKLVIPFLAKVLGGGETDEMRKDAAFWLGQQNDAEGLRILVRAAESDRSAQVREGAVFAVSEVALPEAVDEIINLARNAKAADTRKQAVFWLSQIASKKAGPVLEDLARTDGNIEVQEQAVFALSELPRNEGVEPLIKLAKTHRDPRIRKKAIFWLGESRDPRALEALVSIVKGK